jgi:hypothetical protein
MGRPKGKHMDAIVVVHGTFAKDATWWRPDGEFCVALDKLLTKQGINARCWAASNKIGYFSWNGGNSENERRQGGQALADYLETLANLDEIGSIHIVAHSHGGNVVYRALFELSRTADKFAPYSVGEVVFLGVPWMRFDEYKLVQNFYNLQAGVDARMPEFHNVTLLNRARSFFNSRIGQWLVLCLVGFAGIATGISSGVASTTISQILSRLAAWCIALLVVGKVWDGFTANSDLYLFERRVSDTLSFVPRQSFHCLMFRGDEAMLALSAAANVLTQGGIRINLKHVLAGPIQAGYPVFWRSLFFWWSKPIGWGNWVNKNKKRDDAEWDSNRGFANWVRIESRSFVAKLEYFADAFNIMFGRLSASPEAGPGWASSRYSMNQDDDPVIARLVSRIVLFLSGTALLVFTSIRMVLLFLSWFLYLPIVLMIYLIDNAFGLTNILRAWGAKTVLRVASVVAARMACGLDYRGARFLSLERAPYGARGEHLRRFDQNREKYRDHPLGNLGYVLCHHISDQFEKELAHSLAAKQGQSVAQMYDALSELDQSSDATLELPGILRTVFVADNILHAQYYKCDVLIEMIASIIQRRAQHFVDAVCGRTSEALVLQDLGTPPDRDVGP